jgi:NTP pyrophosphatase (non-canonical NTP hydrolase)
MGILQSQAAAFRSAFQCGNDWNSDTFYMQLSLIQEESREVTQAAFAYEANRGAVAAREDLLKELSDVVFVCYQMAEYLGWDLDEAMRRVFQSNMSKLDENGNVVRRADGKVLKGPSYRPPVLTDLVQ